MRVEEATQGPLQLFHIVPMNTFSRLHSSKDEMATFVGQVAYLIQKISKQRKLSLIILFSDLKNVFQSQKLFCDPLKV